jgi:hypothetical protein
MQDTVVIYVPVALNAPMQVMLIGRLRLASAGQWRYQCLAVAVPLMIAVTMRLLVAGEMIHEQTAIQSSAERSVTTTASVALLAGPWLVSVAAFVGRRRKGASATSLP